MPSVNIYLNIYNTREHTDTNTKKKLRRRKWKTASQQFILFLLYYTTNLFIYFCLLENNKNAMHQNIKQNASWKKRLNNCFNVVFYNIIQNRGYKQTPLTLYTMYKLEYINFNFHPNTKSVENK